jgi:AraC-like DNA-binding protein
MNLKFRYDIHVICRTIIQKELDKFGIEYVFIGGGEVNLQKELTDAQFSQLKANLKDFGIFIIDNQKELLIKKIKDTIYEMIYVEENLPNAKTSTYISEKLGLSYGFIANLFSEVTLTTIENFIILQKIERAKDLIIAGEYTLTEIAHKLNYSSVAHLSNQFKKTTGLTSSAFQRILRRRKEALQKKNNNKEALENTTNL